MRFQPAPPPNHPIQHDDIGWLGGGAGWNRLSQTDAHYVGVICGIVTLCKEIGRRREDDGKSNEFPVNPFLLKRMQLIGLIIVDQSDVIVRL